MTIVGIKFSIDFLWGVLTACVCGVYILWRLSAERALRRAERLEKVLNDMNRAEISETFYKYIERGQQFYDSNRSEFVDGAEYAIDYMLGRFSFLCYLRRKGVIGSAEFSEFAYQIARTISNACIQAYMYDLYVGFDLGEIHDRPFGELIRYGIKCGNKRMKEIFVEFRGCSASRDIKCGDKRNANIRTEVMSMVKKDDSDIDGFRKYLESYYSKNSADTIFSCAKSVSSLLEKNLDELMGDEHAFDDAMRKLSQQQNISMKRIGNFRHALKQYRIYRGKMN